MNIGIIGVGAFGTALSEILKKDNNITMWCENKEMAEIINKSKISPYFNDYIIDKNINITHDLNFIKSLDYIFITIATKYIDSTMKEIIKLYNGCHIVICSKGLIRGNYISDYLKDNYNINKLSVLSGPNFAIDMIKNNPIGINISYYDNNFSNDLKTCFNDNINIIENDYITETTFLATIKNVIAISSGMLKSLNYSKSTEAMLISKAFNEIHEIFNKLNLNTDALFSYSGIGDLILSCTSDKSRNYRFGQDYITNNKDMLKNNTVEGYNSLKDIYALLNNKKVNMQLITTLYEIIYNNKDINILVNYLIK